MANDFTEYVLVLETHNAGDIALVKSILEAEQITYYVLGESSAPYLFNALAMRVMVEKDQAEKAKDILKDITLTYSYSLEKSGEEAEDE